MTGHGEIRLDSKGAIEKALRLEGPAFDSLLLWAPRAGAAFTVIDSDDTLFRARLLELKEGSADIVIFEEVGKIDSSLEVILLQALPEKERMELIIQKTTELGVTAIIPFKSEKSISIGERDARQRKSHKWDEVALKAAKQSRRPDIPQILPFRSFKDTLTHGRGLKILLSERPDAVGLKEFLRGKKDRTVTILVGPEGGFTEKEVEEATEAGFTPVSLGKRILRTETAAIVAVGIVGYEMGE
ncbi:MAG: 16S rRNA (uracil(1498)-N(3))-methyltransferase [Deltaproteobacteria bacterium]|nr:16S rRNA (uracil(1498)-N(3))-methyltransferase [Deltaproteobacteria bacterium]